MRKTPRPGVEVASDALSDLVYAFLVLAGSAWARESHGIGIRRRRCHEEKFQALEIALSDVIPLGPVLLDPASTRNALLTRPSASDAASLSDSDVI